MSNEGNTERDSTSFLVIHVRASHQGSFLDKQDTSKMAHFSSLGTFQCL